MSQFALEREGLVEMGRGLSSSFAAADPFAHVVIDDFFPPEVLDAVLAEFPESEQPSWQHFDKATEIKFALADTTRMGPGTRQFLAELNGQVFTDFLEALTGIDGLVPDPHYAGGGLHQIRPGGFLKVHADFNRHTKLRLDRRLNALIYLNKDWDESYGGHLELWDRNMASCRQRVLPVFNRMVIFATTDFAYHGHPDPLTCPPNRARRSLALYYYSNGRPAEEVSSKHTTLFRERPGEEIAVKRSVGEVAERWVPPAVMDAARALRRRSRG